MLCLCNSAGAGVNMVCVCSDDAICTGECVCVCSGWFCVVSRGWSDCRNVCTWLRGGVSGLVGVGSSSSSSRA